MNYRIQIYPRARPIPKSRKRKKWISRIFGKLNTGLTTDETELRTNKNNNQNQKHKQKQKQMRDGKKVPQSASMGTKINDKLGADSPQRNGVLS